jgi:hypothetical protein
MNFGLARQQILAAAAAAAAHTSVVDGWMAGDGIPLSVTLRASVADMVRCGWALFWVSLALLACVPAICIGGVSWVFFLIGYLLCPERDGDAHEKI